MAQNYAVTWKPAFSAKLAHYSLLKLFTWHFVARNYVKNSLLPLVVLAARTCVAHVSTCSGGGYDSEIFKMKRTKQPKFTRKILMSSTLASFGWQISDESWQKKGRRDEWMSLYGGGGEEAKNLKNMSTLCGECSRRISNFVWCEIKNSKQPHVESGEGGTGARGGEEKENSSRKIIIGYCLSCFWLMLRLSSFVLWQNLESKKGGPKNEIRTLLRSWRVIYYLQSSREKKQGDLNSGYS